MLVLPWSSVQEVERLYLIPFKLSNETAVVVEVRGIFLMKCSPSGMIEVSVILQITGSFGSFTVTLRMVVSVVVFGSAVISNSGSSVST